jgi:hypothetical protein
VRFSFVAADKVDAFLERARVMAGLGLGVRDRFDLGWRVMPTLAAGAGLAEHPRGVEVDEVVLICGVDAAAAAFEPLPLLCKVPSPWRNWGEE